MAAPWPPLLCAHRVPYPPCSSPCPHPLNLCDLPAIGGVPSHLQEGEGQAGEMKEL